LCALVLPLLWIAVAAGFAQTESQGSFDNLLLSAREAQGRGDYAAAAADYKSAVALRSDIPELWSNLGLMQDATGDYDGAVASFRKALAEKPSLYVPNLFLGIDFLHLNRAHQAVPYLVKAERLNGRDLQAPLSLGRAYLLGRDFTSASRAYQRALALDPKNGSAWFGLGIAVLDKVEADGRTISGEAANSAYARALYAQSLQKQGRNAEAVTEIHAVLTSNPRFPCAHATLGFLYLAQGQKQAAAREFAAEPQSCASAGMGEARLHVEENDNAPALVILSDLWKRDPGFVRSHLSLITDGLPADQAASFATYVDQEAGSGAPGRDSYRAIAAALGGATRNAATGAEKLRPAVRDNPAAAEADDRAGHYGRCADDLAATRARPSNISAGSEARELLLAQCAFMTGDYALSAAVSGQLAERSPRNVAALYWSVKANEQLALLAFSRYEQLEPHSERTHLLLGDMYRQRQRFQQAESEYKAASALAPEDTAPLFGLASTYSEDSKSDQALRLALTALEQSPQDPDLNLLAGEILVSQHQWAQAENYLQRSMNAKPQMLPHLHVLLGEVDEHTGKNEEAIREFRLGISSDDSGAVYYQLARIYSSMGNKAAAEDAIAHAKDLEQKRRERAAIAVEDGSDVAESDIR
jgi:tetratricopeptide (TPR) repeat protein